MDELPKHRLEQNNKKQVAEVYMCYDSIYIKCNDK